MSSHPMGWDQNVQSTPAQPSPIPSSSSLPDADSDVSALYVDDSSSGSTLAAGRPCSRGFLNIVRHGDGASAIYVVTYRRLDCSEISSKPLLAEGARLLLDLLERLGVNMELSEVRGALEDVLRLGSANIPDLWLSQEQITEKKLVED